MSENNPSEGANLERKWYWDRRNKKAYYPIKVNSKSIQFITSWNVEETKDAIEGEALVPLDDLGPDYIEGQDVGFDFFDSDRILDDEQLAEYVEDI